MRRGRNASEWAKDIKIDQPGVIAPWVARVANHSAGAGIAETMSFIAPYLRYAGSERRLAGFALPQGFSVFPHSRLLHSVGVIPSSDQAAQQALGEDVPILIFPGGDHETLRTSWQANRVDFGGRTGFLKIARDAGVPIVPSRITMTIDTPIEPEQLFDGTADLPDALTQAEQAVERLALDGKSTR